CRCARQGASGRRRRVLRQVVERSYGLHRIQERCHAQSELITMAIASGQRKRKSEPTSIQSANAPPLRKRPVWGLLEKHYQKLKGVHLRELFADDRRRGERLAIE